MNNFFDIKNTFLNLIQKTYPYGKEKEILSYLPKLDKDEYNNYYLIIGDNKPKTMFTSHLDSACSEQVKVNYHRITDENGDELVYTDRKSILGADDKAGVTLMLYMIANKIPGLYYFFIGEEYGRIGSIDLVNNFNNIEHLSNINKCISFDRRGLNSIITKQLGDRCCSDQFADSLANEYKKNGINMSKDNTGIYTDSASFMLKIPECTNISVGYYNEHTTNEYQNLTFLEKLCKVSVKINWESLTINRKLNIIDETSNKIIHELKHNIIDSKYILYTEITDNNIWVKFYLTHYDLTTSIYIINDISNILKKYNIKEDFIIDDDDLLKIKLR